MSGEMWMNWFSCCSRTTSAAAPHRARRRHRIDISQIGNPTNFLHTVHVGSAEVELSSAQSFYLQNQMKGKGGYKPIRFNEHN